jgi:hypothetical protein
MSIGNWQVNHLTLEVLRTIGPNVSDREFLAVLSVTDMHKYDIGLPNFLLGLHGETRDELSCDHLRNSFYGTAPRSKAPPIEWHFRRDSASTSAAGATLEDAYTDANLFETICQTR